MNDLTTNGATLSPLAVQLQNLINQGLVKPLGNQENLFPSAMIVLPVYDSTGSGPHVGREAAR